jgi:Tfp pilus assembly protein PilW
MIALTLPPLRSDSGTTLMEMLVAVLMSIIVLGALLATLEFTMSQESAIADRVSSDHTARLAMSKIVQELQSSCTGFGATAIQAPSTTPTAPLKVLGPTDLWLLSAFGTASREAAVLSGVTEHDIHWEKTGTSGTGTALGTLTDYAFKSEGGASPNWVFPALSTATANATTLATNVILPGEGAMFEYFTYEASTGVLKPVALTAAETATAAAKSQIAKVDISFTEAAFSKNPSEADTKTGRTTNINNSVVLRFENSVANSESGTSPCA